MYTCAAKVDIGMSENHNDDRMLLGNNLIDSGTVTKRIEADPLLAAVCDGVGGRARGYAAAEITLRVLAVLNRTGVGEDTLRDAIEEANRRVRAYQQEENIPNGARTTLAGAYAEGNGLYVFHAGDSRVYRFRHKYVMQLTKDHSYVQDMIDLGELTAEQAKTHPKRNLINKCVGHEETVNPKISYLEDDFEEQDILMLCSDGISDVLSNREIGNIILEHKEDATLDACCEEIYQRAISNGSLDNLSVMLVRKDG